jgi:hypothetical protein
MKVQTKVKAGIGNVTVNLSNKVDVTIVNTVTITDNSKPV